MKCSSIKLADRNELRACGLQNLGTTEPASFATKERHNYSICLFKNKFSDTNLSVVNIILPEDTKTFNTGSSLKRWSNKRPRLKSSSKSDNKRHELREQSSETNLDVPALRDEFIADVYSAVNFTTNEESSGCNYEYEVVDPDIERLLLLEEQRQLREEDSEMEVKTEKEDRNKHRSKHKKRTSDTNNNDKEKKKKKQKTIKFSLSKPPSPTTEQIIRVDVTSNYSIEETDYNEINDTNGEDCSKEHAKKILRDRNESKRILLHESHSNNSSKSFDDGVDDFVVQCRKLVLNDRRP